MAFIVVSMLVIVALAGLVVAYAAYPHRGEPVPGASWLGEAVERAADAVPTLADGDLDQPQGESAGQGRSDVVLGGARR